MAARTGSLLDMSEIASLVGVRTTTKGVEDQAPISVLSMTVSGLSRASTATVEFLAASR